MMRKVLIATVLLAVAPPSAGAQYDRDGRYVPSPMGVPADPNARPVPMSPGTPGRAIGTPWQPPLTPAPPVARPLPQVTTTPLTGSAPLSEARCEEGWSVKTRMPLTEFESRCRRLLAKRRSRSAID